MEEYKKVLNELFEGLEGVDLKINVDNLSDRDMYLCMVLRACRNKLIDVYNCIGDEGWEMPDMTLRP